VLILGSVLRAAENSGTADSVPRSGEALAHIYCQTCHLFPDPSLLDKQTWVNGALRRMAPLLGAAKVNYEKRPDAQILKEAHIYPDVPLISEQDWRAIMQFYYENASAAPLSQKAQPKIAPDLKRFRPHPLRYPGATALASLVRIDPGKSRIFVGNAGARSLDLVSLGGQLISRVPLDSPPVDLTVRPEGIYLTLIGNMFPSDERKGKLVLVSETNGTTHTRVVLDNLSRPTSATFGDLNGDGRDDLVLCSFGNYVGKFAWYERAAAGNLIEHSLLEQPGAVNAVIDRAGASTAIYVLMAQAREGIHRFVRKGDNFDHQIISEFHPAFGSSHLELVDINGDGFPDLLVTNGDNGDYPSHLKNYHGVRIYLNDGHGNFHESWFYALSGAYKAMAADFDGDGDLDIAAISFFPDYLGNPSESFVYFDHRGGMDFAPSSLPEATLGRWLMMDVGDADGDGDPDIVLGSFPEGPTSVPIPPQLQASWRTNGFSVLYLENQTKKK
jgi:hypothetical protein